MALHLLLSGFFVVSGAGLNIAHPVFANRGYQHGRVVLISTYCALFSMITGVLMGTIVLDEAWPVQWEMRLLRSLSFSLVFFGVLTLNWANICHLQSQAIKRVKSELNGIDSPPDHGGSNGAKKPARVLPGSPTASSKTKKKTKNNNNNSRPVVVVLMFTVVGLDESNDDDSFGR